MKFISPLIFTLVFLSCEIKLKEIPKPENLMEKRELVSLLEDLMVMEQYVQSQYPQPIHYQTVIKESGQDILKEHHVSFEVFDASMTYYGSRQEEMQEIYNQVLENINNKLNKL